MELGAWRKLDAYACANATSSTTGLRTREKRRGAFVVVASAFTIHSVLRSIFYSKWSCMWRKTNRLRAWSWCIFTKTSRTYHPKSNLMRNASPLPYVNDWRANAQLCFPINSTWRSIPGNHDRPGIFLHSCCCHPKSKDQNIAGIRPGFLYTSNNCFAGT